MRLTQQEIIAMIGYNKPFVYKLNSGDAVAWGCFIDDNHGVSQILEGRDFDNGPGYFWEWLYLGGIVEVLDWFTDEVPTGPKTCSCDFYSVILTTGCKCGGI